MTDVGEKMCSSFNKDMINKNNVTNITIIKIIKRVTKIMTLQPTALNYHNRNVTNIALSPTSLYSSDVFCPNIGRLEPTTATFKFKTSFVEVHPNFDIFQM